MDSGSQAAALGAAYEAALKYLNTLDQLPSGAAASLQELRGRLLKPLSFEGVPPERVIRELVEDTRGGLLGSAGGRFFGWVIGGATPAALAADWLTSVWDQNAGAYACGPAAAVVEEAAGAWLKELLGLPSGASFAFVTGCQMAHATCLAAARNALLEARGWNVERDGLSGGPRIRVVTSVERHGTLERAVRFLGLGAGCIEELPSREDGTLAPEELDRALARAPGAPAIVVLQAGDLNLGAFDDFAALIPVARRHGAWVHIDGAFGLWAAASPPYAHFLRGAEQADSWATDGHKWLNVPYDCGYAFVADPEPHRRAMTHRAAYLSHSTEARDQVDWNPEHSRRARGFATYAALRELGRSGVADLVARCCRHARAITEGIGALPGAEVVSLPRLNQGLVRFPDPRPGATPEEHDSHTAAVIERVQRSGEAFFGSTVWRGRRLMRISVCNWRTSPSDVRRAVEAVRAALA
jgi:glutamate/tyrosine decarboxylase-like PLP-dependent enzyme